MLLSPNTGEEVTSEDRGDPGIVIFLSEDAMIHDVMQLPAAAFVPNLTLGRSIRKECDGLICLKLLL